MSPYQDVKNVFEIRSVLDLEKFNNSVLNDDVLDRKHIISFIIGPITSFDQSCSRLISHHVDSLNMDSGP